MIDLDDGRLDLILASIGEHLAVEPVEPVEDGARRASRRLLVGLAVAAVTVLAAVLAIAPVRSAVAGWLGIGSTRIVIDPGATSTGSSTSVAAPSTAAVPTTAAATSTLPPIAAGLRTIDAARAEELLRRPLPALDGTSLGPPAGHRAMPEGGILAVWPDGTTLWIHRPQIDGEQLLKKLIDAGEAVQDVDDLGDEALAVVGAHFLQTPHRTVPASTTVLWQDDGLEWRLESDRAVEDLIVVAREIAAG